MTEFFYDDPYDYKVSTQSPASSGLLQWGTQDVVVEARRNADGQKAAAWVKVSDELMADTNAFSMFIEHQMGLAKNGMLRAIDKQMNPWKYSDPDPFRRFGTFEPFSWWCRWEQRWDKVKHWRYHLAGWVGDMAYKIDPEHEQWNDRW